MPPPSPLPGPNPAAQPIPKKRVAAMLKMEKKTPQMLRTRSTVLESYLNAVIYISAVENGVRRTNSVLTHESGEKGVILERVHTCIYNELRGIFQWPTDVRSLFSRSWKERESSSIRMKICSPLLCQEDMTYIDTDYDVPFVLVQEGKGPQSDYLVVNMEGSRHPLPLTTVYRDLQPINASP
ncbi:hypothetical protein OROGR_030978 [Orobanche gracilis]